MKLIKFLPWAIVCGLVAPFSAFSALAPTQNQVLLSQIRLHELGYYYGAVHGELDAKTIAAVKQFQRENSAELTGKLDADTLRQLEVSDEAEEHVSYSQFSPFVWRVETEDTVSADSTVPEGVKPVAANPQKQLATKPSQPIPVLLPKDQEKTASVERAETYRPITVPTVVSVADKSQSAVEKAEATRVATQADALTQSASGDSSVEEAEVVEPFVVQRAARGQPSREKFAKPVNPYWELPRIRDDLRLESHLEKSRRELERWIQPTIQVGFGIGGESLKFLAESSGNSTPPSLDANQAFNLALGAKLRFGRSPFSIHPRVGFSYGRDSRNDADITQYRVPADVLFSGDLSTNFSLSAGFRTMLSSTLVYEEEGNTLRDLDGDSEVGVIAEATYRPSILAVSNVSLSYQRVLVDYGLSAPIKHQGFNLSLGWTFN